MKTALVVQARFSSARLPGKVLRPLGRTPMLGHLLTALAQCRCADAMIVATSDRADDDAVAAFAQSLGVAVFRGSLDHVAARLLAAGRAAGADAIVRISGDSPLLDPALADRAIELLAAMPSLAVVCNVRPRSFPKGQSVEAIRLDALEAAVAEMTLPYDREHVTPFLYDRTERFAVQSFEADAPRPELQLSVDTAEDLARCEAILAHLPAPPWRLGWQACVAAADALVPAGVGAGAVP
jgi:spore coat polysaccharide biosynthesis protein SpsF